MTYIEVNSLDYYTDSICYFDSILHIGLEMPVFFDSSASQQTKPNHNKVHSRRYDIMSAQPSDWLEINDQEKDDPIEKIKVFFEQYNLNHAEETDYKDLPFLGGIIANFSYELGESFLKETPQKDNSSHCNLFFAGFYNWAIIQDHLKQKSYFISLKEHASENQRHLQSIKQLLKKNSKQPTLHTKKNNTSDFKITQQIKPTRNKTHYLNSLRKIHGYILSGDCYQVNLSQKYSGSYQGNTWQAYKQLRKVAKAPYSVYWSYPSETILCASPERFLFFRNRLVETKPIKGTRPRSQDPVEDKALANALKKSQKDCAENLMIVDLLRNDLGKNCVPGSIKVDELFSIESFPTVHHLVSTISGKLLEGRSHLDTLLDCFPGGSITGAPKVRSMEIIKELEQHTRDIYCGSIAYFSIHGHSDSNICIRTFLCREQTITTWAGGGIVYDSDPEKEYAECGYKIDSLIQSLNKQ